MGRAGKGVGGAIGQETAGKEVLNRQDQVGEHPVDLDAQVASGAAGDRGGKGGGARRGAHGDKEGVADAVNDRKARLDRHLPGQQQHPLPAHTDGQGEVEGVEDAVVGGQGTDQATGNGLAKGGKKGGHTGI